MTIFSFTGHRDLRVFSEPAVKREMMRVVEQRRPAKIISGCALGFDQLAGRLAVHVGVPLTLAVPFEGFDAKWTAAQRAELDWLIEQCSFMHVVCDAGYAAWKYQRRNEWMVDNSDVLVALWDEEADRKRGKLSGTGNCVKYAVEVGREVVRIEPVTL